MLLQGNVRFFAGRISLLSLCIILYPLALSEAQPADFLLKNCPVSSGSNYTSNSTYESNLNTVLSSLSSNTSITYGFYNFSNGGEPDRVYAIALCRGDVALEDCRSCVNDATIRIIQDCPNQIEAAGWYDNCMIRYSNRSIFGLMEASPLLYMYSLANVTSVNEFNEDLQSLLTSLKKQASSGSSTRKYAMADATGPDFLTLYALSQCTPDLSESECNDCLDSAARYIPDCCSGKNGGRVLTPSCNLRYEVYRFYNTVSVAPPSPPPPATGNKSNNTPTIIIIVASSVAVVAVLFICLCIFLRRWRSRKILKPASEIQSEGSLQLDFSILRAATTDFADANKLGQGGFGAVYKGRLPDGKDIAVKRLSMDSGQGDMEFKNEVQLVAQLQHRNLVRLLGFCLEGKERLLIYEFVANASLDRFVFDPKKQGLLNWEKRYKIIEGIIKGLLYLHEDSRLRIIHRDLKASNVLLDENMNSKIADFGMARLFVMDQTHYNTSRIVGTYGYMSPEYAMHGEFSVKSDVYSFGVLILEIVSGQRNNSYRNGENVEDLISYAWRNWREGTWSNLIDRNLRDGSSNKMMRCIHIGLLCVQENVADRPTMATVLLMFNSNSLTLPAPLQPAFYLGSGYDSDASYSRGYDSRVLDSNASKSLVMPLSVGNASASDQLY